MVGSRQRGHENGLRLLENGSCTGLIGSTHVYLVVNSRRGRIRIEMLGKGPKWV